MKKTLCLLFVAALLPALLLALPPNPTQPAPPARPELHGMPLAAPRLRAVRRTDSNTFECFVSVVVVRGGREFLCVPDRDGVLYYDISAAVSGSLRETLEQALQNTRVRVHARAADLVPWEPVPPGTLVSLVAVGSARRSAKNAGTRQILAVRISGTDATLGWTSAAVSNALFGTNGRNVTIKANMNGCSKGVLNFTEYTGTGVVNGVLDVDVNMTIVGTSLATVIAEAKTRTAAALNVSLSTIDHIMWAVPQGAIKGSSSSWAAYATLNGNEVTLRNEDIMQISVQMHETGHNLGFDHSARLNADGSLSEYGDRSCVMGISYNNQQVPVKCFGPSKIAKMGWFTECTETVAAWDAPRRRALVGVSDYVPGVCNASAEAVLVVVDTGMTDDVFVSYNTATGWNAGVEGGTANANDGAWKVIVVKDRTQVQWSQRLAMLSAGDALTYSDTAGMPVVIKYCSNSGGKAVVATGPVTMPDVCADPVITDECAGGTHNCDGNATCTDVTYGFYCECKPGYSGSGTSCSLLPPVNECTAAVCSGNATCTDLAIGYSCACNSGFVGDGVTCELPVNECVDGTHACAAVGGVCTDQSIGYSCACTTGFNGNGYTCTDTNECTQQLHNCNANAVCYNGLGSFVCGCNTGFAGSGVACSDVNECTLGLGTCAAVGGACTNTAGSFTCACVAGFSGTGVTCANVNECTAGTHSCSTHSTCTDTPGAYACVCDAGFALSGSVCTDVDECARATHDCGAHSACSNTVGAFTCACELGFAGTGGRSCADINECATGGHNCAAANSVCSNTAGGFACGCAAGFDGDGVSAAAGGGGCTDRDECAAGTHNCGVHTVCTNTPGSFTCPCAAGFALSGGTCTDVDECATQQLVCNVGGAVCDNTVGAARCLCGAGYSGDGLSCVDIDECETGLDSCVADATCTNTAGSFTCACPVGRSGAQCADINECTGATHNCAAHATCTNTAGSFTCACNTPTYTEKSGNVTFTCRSTEASAPSCFATVTYETWKLSPKVALYVAETDFVQSNKLVTTVLLNDVSVGAIPDMLSQKDQCALFTKVGTVSLPTNTPESAPGMRTATVAIYTSPQVLRRAACAYSLDARLVVTHTSGVLCT